MKNLKVIISAFALTLFVTTAAIAGTTTETTNKNQLRTELIELLGKYESIIDQDNFTASVSFVVNENNELVVLSVDCKNENIITYVKAKLNYKKVIASGISKGEIYVMPLKIQKSS